MNAAKGMHWDSPKAAMVELQGMIGTLQNQWKRREFEASAELADRAQRMAEMLDLKNIRAGILCGKARSAFMQGKNELSEELVEEALRQAEEADADLEDFPSLMMMFNAAIEQEKISFILSSWERIRDHVLAKENFTRRQVEFLTSIGFKLASCRLVQESKRASELALERARQLGCRYTIVRLVRSLAWREVDLGNLESSLAFAEEALALTALDDNPSVDELTSRGDSLVLMAGVHEELCLFAEADKYYREALDTIRRCKNSAEEAPCLNNHGVLLLILGRPDDAEVAFRECTRQKGGKMGKHSFSQINMPEVYHLQGKNELALKEIRKVLALWEGGEGLPLPRTLMVQGDILSALEKFEEAEESYYEGIFVVDSMGGNDKELGTIRVGLGRNMARQGRFEDAARELQTAAALFDKVLRNKSHPRLAVGLTVLAKVLWQLGEVVEARACAERAVRMSEEVFGEKHKEAVAARQAWDLVDSCDYTTTAPTFL